MNETPMKATAKRDNILAVAKQVFQEMGFEGASMNDILERVGGSKATLYKHFASKEILFFEVVFPKIEEQIQANMSLLDNEERSAADILSDYALQSLILAYSPEIAAARRLTIAEANRLGIGPRGYTLGYLPTLKRLTGFMQREMTRGQLRQADAEVAALQYSALVEAELLQPFLFHCMPSDVTDGIPAKVARAIDTFMRAYGPR